MVFSITRNTIWIIGGVACTMFIGYCIYFDKKRRSDPEYKKKVRERRQRQQKEQPEFSNMREYSDYEKIQKYFLNQIQLGEHLISRGEIERGVEFIANGILVCSRPGPLLRVLQTTLPSSVFALLIIKMQEQGGRYLGVHGSESDSGSSERPEESERICREKLMYIHNRQHLVPKQETSMMVDDLE